MMMPSLKDDCQTSLRNCFNSTRFIILIISTAALSFVMANSLALNFTIICMIKEPIGGEEEFIHELNITDPEPLYTLGERSWLFSAIAIGNIIGTIPLTWSNNRFGVRKTFSFYGFISAISTLLLPLFVEISFILAFVARVLQGFGLAISLTSLGAIVSAWSSLDGAGMFISLLSMHIQFGAIMVMPISGALCQSSIGWPAVYYILGGFTILFFILFFMFYRDDPALHCNVSQKELEKIEAGRITTGAAGEKHPTVPYKRIVFDLPVIGIIVSCFGGSLGLQIMFQYGPTYLNKVLGFDLTKTGFAAALPYVFSVIVKMFAGPFSDLITCISDRGRIIFFNTMSQLPMCICFILMAVIPSQYGWIIQIAYSLVNSFSGLNAVGVAKCVQLMAQHHSHFIMTLMSLINSIVILILPPMVSVIAPDNSPEQWAIVFYIISVCIFVTMMFFNFTCQVTPRDWALEDKLPMVEVAPKKSLQGVTVEFESAGKKVISGQIHNLQILPLDSPSEPVQGRSEVSLIITTNKT